MTPAEASSVLAPMLAAWPYPAMPRETVELWVAFLCEADVNVSDARAIAHRCVHDHERFPSIAAFRSLLRARTEPHGFPELDEADTFDPVKARENVRKLRGLLAQVGRRA